MTVVGAATLGVIQTSPRRSRHSGGQANGSDRAGRDPRGDKRVDEETRERKRFLVEDLAGECASVAEGD